MILIINIYFKLYLIFINKSKRILNIINKAIIILSNKNLIDFKDRLIRDRINRIIYI